MDERKRITRKLARLEAWDLLRAWLYLEWLYFRRRWLSFVMAYAVARM